MKYLVTPENIIGVLLRRAGGRVEIAGDEVDIAVDVLTQREQMLFYSTVDASGALVWDRELVDRVVVEVLPVTEVAKRLEEQRAAHRAYLERKWAAAHAAHHGAGIPGRLA